MNQKDLESVAESLQHSPEFQKAKRYADTHHEVMKLALRYMHENGSKLNTDDRVRAAMSAADGFFRCLDLSSERKTNGK